MAGKNRLYPHLLPDDISLWERFLASPQNIYEYYDYDVRVGQGRDPGNDYDLNIRQMAIGLSQRRIDAIGYLPNKITIIEITVSAGLKAIGQLKAYPELYQIDFAPARPVYPLLIAESIQSDILPILAKEQIPFLTYPKN